MNRPLVLAGTRRVPVPLALAAATVLAQVCYPLVSGDLRDRLTVATVVLFFLASVTHAGFASGRAWAATYVGIACGVGLFAEAVGVSTGQPFGDYIYSTSLGPKVAGVPLVIPLAWAMMAYPALLAARRLTRSRVMRPIVGGLALASWDLFLDPMMVDEGHWRWTHLGTTLPGVADVPLHNFTGWLGVSVVLMVLLDRLPDRAVDNRVPIALYVWTWASSVLANAVFFDRLPVALWGGIVMGLVAVPLAMRWPR